MVSRRAEVSGLSGWTALAHAFSCPNCGSGDCWRTGLKPARGIFWGALFRLLTWLVILTPRGGYLG